MECLKPLVLQCFIGPTPLIKGVNVTPLIKGVWVCVTSWGLFRQFPDPVLLVLDVFVSLVFSLLGISLVFWGVFCLFSKVFRGSPGERILDVFEVFLGIFEKTKEKKDRFNSVQTRCIVKGEAQKSPLFWRFSGVFGFLRRKPVL